MLCRSVLAKSARRCIPGPGYSSLTSRPHARTSPLDRITNLNLNFSPSRSVSPLGGWSIINRVEHHQSPLGPGHRSAAGGRRRFFGLSEAAEAEAEAAMRAEGEGEKAASPARDEGTATSTSVAEKRGSGVGAGNPVIDAHRFLLSLRSDPMRAMLRSGKSNSLARG